MRAIRVIHRAEGIAAEMIRTGEVFQYNFPRGESKVGHSVDEVLPTPRRDLIAPDPTANRKISNCTPSEISRLPLLGPLLCGRQRAAHRL